MDGYIRVKAGKEFWDILNLIFTDRNIPTLRTLSTSVIPAR